MSVLDDPVLLKTCVENKVPFTFCPQSILSFNRMQRLDDLRLKEMLEMGLIVSLNSDDAAYNRAYIGDNFYLCIQ